MKIVYSFGFALLAFIPIFAQVVSIPYMEPNFVTPYIATPNPLALNGHAYHITYTYVNDSTITWNLNDVTTHKAILTNQPQNAFPVSADNMLVAVSVPKANSIKMFTIPHGMPRLSGQNASNLVSGTFSGPISYASPRSVFGDGIEDVPASALKNILLVFAKVTDTSTYNPAFDTADVNMSYAYRYGRGFANTPADARFVPYILNMASGYSFQDFTKSVPLSAWDINDPLHPRRLAVGFLENNAINGLVDGKWWPGPADTYNNTDITGPREWLWIFNADYSATANPAYEVEAIGNPLPVMYMLTFNRNGHVPFSPDSTGEDQIAFLTSFKDISEDTCSFTATCTGYAVPNDHAKKLNLNNISTWEYDNGYCDIDQNLIAGFFYPRGTRSNAVFQSGLVWGGFVSGDASVRVGGSTYRTGMQRGRINESGYAVDPSLPENRLYRIRPDYATADLTTEVSDEWVDKEIVKAIYSADWNGWPAASGAPYVDVNKNGVYDPGVDIAGINGAAQTMWFVANDLNASLTSFLYGSEPMGIEMQATYWNYTIPGALSNAIFKKYRLINKSSARIDSMYLSMWADVDIGYAYDDFVGTDTVRKMVYTYNGESTDQISGVAPPAVGYTFLQTPTVVSAGDSAYTKGKWTKGKRNLPVSASYYFTNGDATVYDPTLGAYNGSVQFYNFMRGRIGATGTIYADQNNISTLYPLAGDPVTKTGWVDGILFPMADRRMGISSGPFSFAPGDTQEVIFAEIAATASPDSGNIKAIVKLRQYCDSVRAAFYSLTNMSTEVKNSGMNQVKKFALYQNYPNPFNPVTIIRYELPAYGKVSLKIYDMLGREVAVPVNQEQSAGPHEISFDGSRLASGVYIYKITSNTFSAEKKMLLLK